MAISQDDLQSAEDIILAAIKEQFPNVETRPGTPMRELVVAAGAIGFAVINDELTNFSNTQSLLSLTENPELIDDSVIDAIMSNWFATRKPGSKAVGYLKIVVATDKTYFVPENQEFTTSDDLVFVTQGSYVVEREPTDSNSLELVDEQAADAYFFILPVAAAEEGSEYSIVQETPLNTTLFGSELIVATAFTDFNQGIDQETTENLIDRVGELITVRDLISPKAIKAVLTEEYEYVRDIAVVRNGSREMLRDKYPIIGFGVGGKADIYLRTSLSAETKTLSKTTDGDGKFTIDAAEVPFYKITQVSAQTTPESNLEFSVAYSYDMSNTSNELNSSAVNARFSVYERATVTVPGCPSTQLFIRMYYPPNIAEIQTRLLDEDLRVVAADYIAKGIVPCFTKINIEYTRDRTSETPNIDALKSAIFNYVNSLKAGDVLNASNIIDICHNYSITRVKLPIALTGDLHRTDGITEELSSSDMLTIPEHYDIGMSQFNSVYFITLEDISVTEVT